MESGYLHEDPSPKEGPVAGKTTITGAGPGNRVVVTGAAGFIGSHLVETLIGRRCEVLGLDNFDPWYDPKQKRENLAMASRSSRFSLVEKDLLVSDMATLFDGAHTVFHLAARPGVQDSWGAGFADTCELNISLTQRVFEAAAAVGVRRVVYASSSSVYGETSGGGGPTVAPISPYGVAKAAGEQLAQVYGRRGLDVVSLRFFTVFGPRQRPDMAIHRLMTATSPFAEPFLRRGAGSQRRQFTFVGDVVDAAATVGLSGHPALAGTTFDVGGGSIASLNDVIEAVADVCGHKPKLEQVGSAPGDPQLTAADIEPLRRLVGWQPSTSLRQGLEQQWQWHQLRRPLTDVGRQHQVTGGPHSGSSADKTVHSTTVSAA